MRLHSPLAAALASCVLLAACGPAGDTATESTATGAESVATAQPARINGHPNLNGVWQAMNTAHWNLEGGAAQAVPEYWRLGALFAVPPGQSVVEGGTIPYLPEALEQRDKNRVAWPANDPETKCYRAGITRSTYMPYPFQIVQGDGDIMFVYEYATSSRPVRIVEPFEPARSARRSVARLVERAVGRRRATCIDDLGRFATRGSTAPAIITPA